MKRSILLILGITFAFQLCGLAFFYALEARYPDFDKNGYPLPVVGQDAPDFYRLGKNLRDYNFFSLDNKTPENFRTPGFPAVLAFTGVGWVGVVINMLIASIGAVVVYLIAQYFVHERISFYTALVYGALPNVIFHGVVFLSDSLFTTLLLVVVYFALFKNKYLFISGLGLGFAMLTRPIAMFLPIVFVGFLLYKKLYKQSLVFLLGALIVAGPWVWRNYHVSGVPALSSITTYNMAFYNVPLFYGVHTMPELQDLEKKYDVRLLENQKYLKEFTDKKLKGNMIAYGIFHIESTVRFFLSSQVRYVSINTGNIFNDAIGIGKGVVTLLNLDRLFMIGICGLMLISFRKDKAYHWAVLAVLIVYFAILTGPVAIPRYRLPVDGYMLVLAVFSLCSIEWGVCAKLLRKR